MFSFKTPKLFNVYLGGRTQGLGQHWAGVTIPTVVQTGHGQLHKAVLGGDGNNVQQTEKRKNSKFSSIS